MYKSFCAKFIFRGVLKTLMYKKLSKLAISVIRLINQRELKSHKVK